jgi:multidrug efflux system membrane fusion protein
MNPAALAPEFKTVEESPAVRLSPAKSSTRIDVHLAKTARLVRPVTKSPRSVWKWAVAVVVVAVVLIARPWRVVSDAAAHRAERVAPQLNSVTVVRPAAVSVSSVVLPATVRPWQSTALHARVSGYLAAWNRDLGSHVKAGEVLAAIDTPELDQELAESQAMALEADAAAIQARTEKQESEADLKVAEAQLVRAEAEAALARSQLVRREQLFSKQVITREEYDTFAKDVEARAADVAAVKSDVTRRRANLQTRAATINAREATAKSRAANVERLMQMQGFKKIVAPFGGVVTRRSAELGMLVTAGKESLFTIEDMSRVRVQVSVPQTYSQQMNVGAEVAVRVPEASGEPARATITRMADSVDSSNRTMLAEIEINNSDRRFQPGSYAQVTLATSQTEMGWTIPTNTLSMRVDGPHVAIVNDQEHVQIKPVSLGRDYGRTIAIIEGIQGNERLVVNPSDRLTEGVQVHIENGSQSPANGVAALAADGRRAD